MAAGSCIRFVCLLLAIDSVASGVAVTFPGIDLQVDTTLESEAPNCIYTWGDNSVEQFQSVIVSNHNYNTSGVYVIAIYCFNDNAFTVVYVVPHYAGNTIKGIDVSNGTGKLIIPLEWPLTSDIHLNIGFTDGTDIDVWAYLLGTEDVFHMRVTDITASNPVIFQLSNFETCDLYSIRFNFQNSLSTVPIEAYAVLAIQKPVSPIFVNGLNTYFAAPIGHDFPIVVTVTGGDVSIISELYDGATLQQYDGVYCEGDVETASITYKFDTPIVANVVLTASNFFNIETTSFSMESVYTLADILHSITDGVSFQADAVNFGVQFDSSADYTMGYVNISVDFGDGLSDSILVDARSAPDPTGQLDVTFPHTYAAAGLYMSTITVSNGLPVKFNFSDNVTIVYPIENIQLVNPTDGSTHKFSQKWAFSVTSSNPNALDGLSLYIDYGTGEPVETAHYDLPADGSFEHTHKFPTAGDFTITVNVSNPKDFKVFTTTQFVEFDCWISNKFFDTQFNHSSNPFKFSAIVNPFKVAANIKTDPASDCFMDTVYTYVWSMTEGEANTITPYADSRQTQSAFFYIDKGSLDEGLYQFSLRFCFATLGACLEDFLYLNVFLPPPIAKIEGSVKRSVNGYDEESLELDASASHDPVGDLPTVASIPEDDIWECGTSPSITEDEVDLFLLSTDHNMSQYTDTCQEIAPNGKTLKFPSNRNQLNHWFLICYTISRGPRSDKTCAAVNTVEGEVLDASIKCISNCKNAACGKVKYEEISRDVIIEASLDKSTADYEWKVTSVLGSGSSDFTPQLEAEGISTTNPGLSLPKAFLEYSGQIIIAVKVTVPNRPPATVYDFVSVNSPPYGGTCFVDRTNGTAVVDEFCVTCSGWKDENENPKRDVTDKGERLRYTVVQKTPGSVVSETTLVDASTKLVNCVTLSRGDKSLDFQTTIAVHVIDICSNYNKWNVTVKAYPALDSAKLSEVNNPNAPTEIASFSDKLLRSAETAERVSDVTTSTRLTTELLSETNTLETPTPPPIIPDEVDPDGGGLSDVNTDGTAVSANDAFADITHKKPDDDITKELQNSNEASAVLLGDLANQSMSKTEKSPTALVSIAASMTVLMSAPKKNINTNTMDMATDVLNVMAESLASVDDDDKEDIAQSLLSLGEATANAVVPEGMENLVPSASTIEGARETNAALFETADENTKDQIELAEMSPDERDAAFAKKQLKLNVDVHERRENMKKAATAIDNTVGQVQQNLPMCEGCQKEIKTAGLTLTLSKSAASEMAKTPLKSDGNTVTLKGLEGHGQTPVSIAVASNKVNLFMSGDGQQEHSSSISSGTTRIFIKSEDEMPNGVIVLEQEVGPTFYETVDPNEIINPDDASGMVVKKQYATLAARDLCLTVKPPLGVMRYDVFALFDTPPTLINFKAKTSLGEDNSYTDCILGSNLDSRSGILYFGLKAIAGDSSGVSRRKRAANATDATEDIDVKYLPYQLATTTVKCMTYDDNFLQWLTTSCETEWLPNEDKIKCTCPDLPSTQLTFANSFYTGPNKIDFSSVFLKFSPLSQAAVMGALSGILVLYILAIIWARRQDKKDVLKWGITPLVDNFPEDNYFYIVKVYTGIRPGSTTRSQIGFVLGGDEMDTGVRELYDGVRREFSTGSIMNFLLSTPSWLGPLEYMRVWHDNSGVNDYASWYLSKIEIQDVQRQENFTFLAERWLAIEKQNGALECVIPVVDKENMNVFKYRLFSNAKDNLSENHIWVSVFYRPTTSNFTRVQRVSCALVFVLLTMIANAMFFKGEEDYETPATVAVGPFRFSLKQVYISVISALITTPATLLIVYLFRRTRSKVLTEHDIYQNPKKANRYKIPFMESWLEKQQKESVTLEKNLVSKGYPKFDGFHFPYWMVYMAWFLTFASVFLSAFFIMLYSIEWGKQKSEEWLSTFLLSFFESVFCLDPIKIGIMALIFSLIFRSVTDTDSMIDRKTIMQKYSGTLRGKSGGIRLPAPPLDQDSLVDARELRHKELKMKATMKDIVVNVFLVWILFSISYSNRDSRSYYLHQDIVDKMLTPISTMKFESIKSETDYFKWMTETAIPNLFPDTDPNGDRLHWRERQFMSGGASYRLGPPRLRQLRTTKDSCTIPIIGTVPCYGKYSEPTEETGSYCIGWERGHCDPEDLVYKFSSDAWKFTSAFDIWGFPLSGFYTTYGGGGYIGNLDVNRNISITILDELYMKSWVDRQTRAVVFEFTLYCINANIFTYSMFMVEFPETGGAITFYYILPLRIYQHIGAIGLYTIACEGIYLLFVIALTVIVVIDINQQRRAFFRSFWQIWDFAGLIGSYVAIFMYVARLLVSNQTIEKFTEDPKKFVNFYHIALWDQIFVLLLGLLVFIATVRLLHILGYNKRIGAVASVFTSAASDLIWFGIFFTYVFVTYSVFGYLLFGATLKSYKDVYSTLGTLFISMIGKSRFTEIEQTDPIMSKLYFIVFIFFVVYLILTMFLAVLSKSIDAVHLQTKNNKDEELVDFMLSKFKNLFSFGNKSKNQAPPVFTKKPNWHQPGQPVDNKAILQDIRSTLTEAFGPKGLKAFEDYDEKKSRGIRLN